MVWVIAFSSPDSLVISSISLWYQNYSHLSKFRTLTNPATVTMSIGLLADALLSWFLHRHLDNFIVTGQLLPTYRDSAIWTTSPGQENLRPSTGTLQKLMPTPPQTATPHTTGPLPVIRTPRYSDSYQFVERFIM